MAASRARCFLSSTRPNVAGLLPRSDIINSLILKSPTPVAWHYNNNYRHTQPVMLVKKLSFYRGDRPFRRPQAQDLIMHLNAEERRTLSEELQAYAKVVDGQHQVTGTIAGSIVRPSAAQLRAVAMCSAFPFIGFGFLDNFIMIIAGDYIDLSLGVTLGISTMAAAALGNLISDIAGVGSAWYVENVSAKIGFTPPLLTPEQLALSSTTFFSYLGKALGVTLGCLLGMFPLLFLHTGNEKQQQQQQQQQQQ